MTTPAIYDAPGSGLPRTKEGIVIDPNSPVQVVIQNAPAWSFVWDVFNGPGATSAPSTLMTAVGSVPVSSNFWNNITNASIQSLGTYGRQVALFGSASAVGFAQTQFTFPAIHNAVVVKGAPMRGFRQFVFEAELAASQLPTNNVAGIAGNCVGFFMQQSNGQPTQGTGGVDGILTFSSPYFGMVAAADGNWYISAGTNARAGGPPFPPDVLPLTLLTGDILNIHTFTFTLTSATAAADATFAIAVDGVTKTTISWALTSSPRMPGYSSGALPWWRFGLAGDNTAAGTVGRAGLICAGARAVAA